MSTLTFKTNKLNIGTVTIQYDEAGKAFATIFTSAVTAIGSGNELIKLLNSSAPKEEQIKKHADAVLATVFSNLNIVELADRDKYAVTSNVVSCEKYENGNVKTCILQYYLTEI